MQDDKNSFTIQLYYKKHFVSYIFSSLKPPLSYSMET